MGKYTVCLSGGGRGCFFQLMKLDFLDKVKAFILTLYILQHNYFVAKKTIFHLDLKQLHFKSDLPYKQIRVS